MHIPHRAIPGFFWDEPELGLGAGATTLQYASLLWDAFTLELWPALLRGGRCVLYDAPQADAREIARHVREHGVDTLLMTSTFFNAVVDDDVRQLAGLRTVMIGGEQVSAAHVRKALDALPGLRLVNGYGPCEATVIATSQVLDHAVLADTTRQAPIGRAVGDRSVHLLDERLQPVPAGAVGEICVGGDGLAHGYIGRAALTAERFVPDPFGNRAGSRLYRTGDLGRQRDDGLLEFIGRRDDQVKLRGFRIELGEVTHALQALPGVASAAALVREDRPGDRRLVGYLVPQSPPQDLDTALADWRHALGRALPAYMQPAHLVCVPALPLTSNGKLDRRALPAPADAGVAAAHVPPVGALQEGIAGVMAGCLGLDTVSARANFFELGGHSMLAVRLMGRLREQLGVDLPLRALYEAPTVEGLARQAESGTAAASHEGDTLVALAGASDAPPLFVLHPVGGGVWAYHALAARLADRWCVLGLQAPPSETAMPLPAHVRQLADAVQQRQPAGDLRLLGWSTGGLLAQRLAAELEARGRTVGYLGLVDTHPVPAGAAGADGRGDTRLALAALLAPRHHDATGLLAFEAEVRVLGLDAQAFLDPAHEAHLAPLVARWFDAALTPTDLRLQLLATRAQLAWWAGADPAAWPQVPVHRIVADASPALGADDAARLLGPQAPAATDVLAGDHHGLLREPQVAALAASVCRQLERAAAAP